MRILRVISTIDPKGGGPMEGARRIDAELIKMGHNPEVLTLDDPKEDFLNAYPAEVHALGPSSWGYKYNRNLVGWLRQNVDRYDAIIVNGLWQYHSFAVWRAVKRSHVPYFVFAHGMLDPWFKKRYPIKHIKKWLYWPWAEYRVLRDARASIFTCEEEKVRARKSFWLYRTNEAVTSYGTARPPANEIELRERFLAKHPALHGKRLILFLSRIHEKKGCDLLIEAFSNVAQNDESLHLVMVGPDQNGLIPSLRILADRLRVGNRISWIGTLQGDDKWGAFYSSDVFCLPSHQENFGIAVAEALACGRPVLISDKVNIWREVEGDGAGFVDEDTVAGTRRNLERWLALTEEGRVDMSVRASSSFSGRFEIRKAAERLVEIILDVK